MCFCSLTLQLTLKSSAEKLSFSFLLYFFNTFFEKLLVYQKAKSFNLEIYSSIYSDKTIDRIIAHQLRRAALSIPLNIAEGTSRFSKADRKNFYVIARGSVFECVAIFDLLKGENKMQKKDYTVYYEQADELSKILYAMIKSLN